MPSMRLRDLGITIGHFPTGPLNAITDVAGVTVGHYTLIHDQPRVARTGITIVLPRGESTWTDYNSRRTPWAWTCMNRRTLRST